MISINKIAISILILISLFFCKDQVEDPALKDLGEPGDFTLTDHTGKSFSTEDIFGRARLIFFGFTNCPDFCPQTLSKIQRAYSLLPDNETFEEKPVVLFITVDPVRDTPNALAEYLTAFPELETVGLTGSKDDIKQVTEQYGAHYRYQYEGTEGQYNVEHSVNLYVMGPEGQLRYLLKPDEDAKKLSQLIEELYYEMQ